MLGGEQDGGGWVALVLMNRMMVAYFYAHPLQNMVVCTMAKTPTNKQTRKTD